MTTQEFSAGFDVLLGSFSSEANFGEETARQTIELDEHEKSVFLTESQEEIILSLYNGRNSSRESLESSEELRRYLSPLYAEAELDPITNTSGKPIGIDDTTKTKFFTLPDGTGEYPAVWFITYESVKLDPDDRPCAGVGNLEVSPVTQDEYHRIRKNPFRGANKRRALRLDLSDGIIEIVSKYTVTKYYVRYLKKLKPIVLAPLDDQSIDGESNISECEVHESLHKRILELAVDKALRSRGYIRNNTENR